MSSKNKNKWNCITSNVTGCGCGKPKLSDIIQPDPKPKPKPISSSNSDHTSTTLDSPSPPLDFDQTVDIKSSNNLPSKIVGSVAVVKDSDDPFEDFRQSMLQMIMEKEIYSCDDLNELLNCFLKLNSSSHHDVIVQAFMEIWNNGKIVPNKEEPS